MRFFAFLLIEDKNFQKCEMFVMEADKYDDLNDSQLHRNKAEFLDILLNVRSLSYLN